MPQLRRDPSRWANELLRPVYRVRSAIPGPGPRNDPRSLRPLRPGGARRPVAVGADAEGRGGLPSVPFAGPPAGRIGTPDGHPPTGPVRHRRCALRALPKTRIRPRSAGGHPRDRFDPLPAVPRALSTRSLESSGRHPCGGRDGPHSHPRGPSARDSREPRPRERLAPAQRPPSLVPADPRGPRGRLPDVRGPVPSVRPDGPASGPARGLAPRRRDHVPPMPEPRGGIAPCDPDPARTAGRTGGDPHRGLARPFVRRGSPAPESYKARPFGAAGNDEHLSLRCP